LGEIDITFSRPLGEKSKLFNLFSDCQLMVCLREWQS
jgi:hypothetical protein